MKNRRIHPAQVSLYLLLVPLLLVIACGDEANGDGDGTTCQDDERLVDGVCQRNRPGRDVDTNPTDTGTDSGLDTSLPDLGDSCDAPGVQICADPTTLAICGDDNTYTYENCEETFRCQDGFCIPNLLNCTPGVNLGCNDANSFRICNDTGDDYDVTECPDETPNCLGASGECSNMVCPADSTRCGSDNNVETCTSDGSQWETVLDCGTGLVCDSGECLSPCDANAKVASFLGCDYWALDLDNIAPTCTSDAQCSPGETCNMSENACTPSAADQQYSVSVSNPNDATVTVTIFNNATDATSTVTVPARTAQAIAMDRLDVNGTGISENAFHITTDLPVTLHQFNPANNVGVASNDASLLLPTNSSGLNYVILNWPTGPFSAPTNNAFSYATVVAVAEEDPTSVTITPSVSVPAGTGVNAMAAGTPSTLILQPGEVLNFQTAATDFADLSGTVIEASQPVIVFAGHECAFVLDEEPTLYCDHIEQQLFPVEAWGSEYFVAKARPRGSEIDVYRVVAATEGTMITTDPPVSGANGITIGPGDVLEFSTSTHFRISGSNPISVGQFLVGSNYAGVPSTCAGGLTGIGDPAFMLAVPTNQYRQDYTFLVPADYREDWVTVIAEIGTELNLDGVPQPVAPQDQIGSTVYGVFYYNLANSGGSDPAGAHTLTGSRPFALQVYGYDCDVSYAYPGGLNLEVQL